jgi:hypothetical protein
MGLSSVIHAYVIIQPGKYFVKLISNKNQVGGRKGALDFTMWLGSMETVEI